MSTDQGGGLPNFSGGGGAFEPQGGDGRGAEPAGADPYAVDPHAVDPLAAGPGFQDSFADWSPQFGGVPQYGSRPLAKPTSDAAITGFALALIGLFLCGGLLAPISIFFAVRGMSETADGGSKGGRGFAVAAMVLSVLGLVYLAGIVLYIVFVVVLAVASY